jgi:hypothetical protein
MGQSHLCIQPMIMLLLEELLIDFQELQGEHSGENMAEALWETLKQYDCYDFTFTLQTDGNRWIIFTFLFFCPVSRWTISYL